MKWVLCHKPEKRLARPYSLVNQTTEKPTGGARSADCYNMWPRLYFFTTVMPATMALGSATLDCI